MIGPRVIDTINAIERELPVTDWSVNGLRVWPLVRYLLGADMVARWRLPEGVPPGSAGLDRGKARALRLLREYAGWTRARIADRRNHQPLGRPYDAVFLQIFPRPLRINGRWTCPFAEPLRWHLGALGLDMLVLDLCGGVRGYPIPRHAPSHHVSFEDRLAIRIRTRQYPAAQDVHLPEIARLAGLVTDWPGIPIPSETTVLDLVRTVSVWSDYFGRIFARTRPRIGFVPSYFGPAAFAFVLACHKAGIPSVNLQHGYQGADHVAFGSWTAVPPGGYDLLPSYFWCWSRTDVAAIEAWASRVNRHLPIYGGNPWINMWNRLRERGDPADRMDDVFAESGCVHVLYTFPPEPQIPASVLDAIRTSPPSWRWWLRLHPARLPGAAQEVRAQLRDLGNVRVEIDRATDAPLFELLRFVDVHVTPYSTVVQEAATFGVPSVVVHPIGRQYYAEIIAAGLAVNAMTPDSIRAAIEHFSGRQHGAAIGQLHLSEEGEAQVVRGLLARAGMLDADGAGVLSVGRPAVPA